MVEGLEALGGVRARAKSAVNRQSRLLSFEAS